MNKDLECKSDYFSLTIEDIEKSGEFSGYASIFDVIDNHNDIIIPGAFKHVDAREIKLLWQHRPDEPIGTIDHIAEDNNGLFVEGKLLLAVEKAREAYALLKSGAIKGLSIGYTINDFDIHPQSGARLLKDLNLFEISLVTFPANELANVTKVKAHIPETVREFETFLREAGFSRNKAKAISLKGFSTFNEKPTRQREVDSDYNGLENAITKIINTLT